MATQLTTIVLAYWGPDEQGTISTVVYYIYTSVCKVNHTRDPVFGSGHSYHCAILASQEETPGDKSDNLKTPA